MITNNIKQDIKASEQIVSNFLARFLPHYDYEPLLLYAALPLVLTPELLHYLRHRFTPKLPWVAEVDILLAEELCRERGYEQYIMNTPIRLYLLERRKKRDDISTEDAAKLMVQYLHAFARTQPYATSSDMQAQQLSALAFIKDEQSNVVQDVIRAIENATNQQFGGESNIPELRRLAAFAEQLALELENYPEIFEHTQRIRSILSGDAQISETTTESLQKTRKLFISYHRSDAVKVDKITYDLKLLKYDNGTPRYTTWQDNHYLLPASSNWWDAIIDAIIDCDIFVLTISRASLESEICRAEFEYALARNRSIIPVVLEGEFFFNQQTGNYDFPGEILVLLPDLLSNRQFLFYETTTFLDQFQNLVALYESNQPRDILVTRPSHPNHKNDNLNIISYKFNTNWVLRKILLNYFIYWQRDRTQELSNNYKALRKFLIHQTRFTSPEYAGIEKTLIIDGIFIPYINEENITIGILNPIVWDFSKNLVNKEYGLDEKIDLQYTFCDFMWNIYNNQDKKGNKPAHKHMVEVISKLWDNIFEGSIHYTTGNIMGREYIMFSWDQWRLPIICSASNSVENVKIKEILLHQFGMVLNEQDEWDREKDFPTLCILNIDDIMAYEGEKGGVKIIEISSLLKLLFWCANIKKDHGLSQITNQLHHFFRQSRNVLSVAIGIQNITKNLT